MALTDSAIKAAKPKASQYKLHDEKGLLLIVRPAGGKLWRLKYRFAGKEQQLTIGTYPEVGLKEARERRDAARKVIAERTVEATWQRIGLLLDAFPPHECANYLRNSGYASI